MVTDRQLELLNLIVANYVKNGEPVSSGALLENNPELNLSSATIRNEMVELEKLGYIIKLDSSSSRTSGRTPTKKGYEHYLKSIKTNPDSIVSIKAKLDDILADRSNNIDKVLSNAMELINETTNTLTITKDEDSSETIVDINSYPLGEDKAVIIVVTSSGKVINNESTLNDISYKDFSKAVGTLSKRLKNANVSELKDILDNLGEIIAIEIKSMEEKFQEVIRLLINKLMNSSNKYQGMNSLVTADSLDVKTQISAIFKMIENNSIWDMLTEDGTIENDVSGVTVDVDFIDGVSIVKKDINLGKTHKQLTLVGSRNQDYEKLFSLLAYLEEKIGE